MTTFIQSRDPYYSNEHKYLKLSLSLSRDMSSYTGKLLTSLQNYNIQTTHLIIIIIPFRKVKKMQNVRCTKERI